MRLESEALLAPAVPDGFCCAGHQSSELTTLLAGTPFSGNASPDNVSIRQSHPSSSG